jgi:hypothetical protein
MVAPWYDFAHADVDVLISKRSKVCKMENELGVDPRR